MGGFSDTDGSSITGGGCLGNILIKYVRFSEILVIIGPDDSDNTIAT